MPPLLLPSLPYHPFSFIAGLLQGNILKRMFETTRSQGLGGLYWGFWPYCFESWPYDVSELVVYGHLKDLRQEACTASTSAAAAEVSATGAAARGGRWGRKGGNGGSSSGRIGDKGGAACEATASSPEQQQKHRWVSRLPDDVWDLATGAAAGATAVVLSMPLDCIKTAVQTSGTDVAGRGLAGSARVFVATGKALVERRGLGALYVGLTPRLLQQVPSAMACWWTVEACKRALAPYTVSSPGQA